MIEEQKSFENQKFDETKLVERPGQ